MNNDDSTFKKIADEETDANMQTLVSYREEFTQELTFNVNLIKRLEDLMSRASAKKWNTKKKQKMVRRLIDAQTSVGQYETILNQVADQIARSPE